MINEIEKHIDSIRTCANCACHSMQTNLLNPAESQMFCRRDPPMAQRMRIKVPVIRDGKPVMMRDNKTPLMTEEDQVHYMFRPTLATLVCFDGWRAEGTEPGQRSSDALDGVTGALKRLWADMMTQQQEEQIEKLPMPEDFGEAIQKPWHMGDDGAMHDGSDKECGRCHPDLPDAA
jgi:hypothetical protein